MISIFYQNRAEKFTDFEHPTLQGVNALLNSTQGVALVLSKHLGFQPALAKSELEFLYVPLN